MNSILITGCNRGIGLGLVNKIVNHSKKPQHVIATCRNIENAKELQNIAARNKNVHILQLDLKNFDSYKDFATKVSTIVGENGLNVLFNNAGISSKFSRINLVKTEQITDALLTNTVAPIMLTKALFPLLKKSAVKNSDAPMGVSKAAVINMSSILGSIAHNSDGGYYPYRCSKAALNMATKSMASDFKNDQILVISLHPGWVKTDMGGVKAPMKVETSVADIWKLLHNLKEDHNGAFLQHDGSTLDW